MMEVARKRAAAAALTRACAAARECVRRPAAPTSPQTPPPTHPPTHTVWSVAAMLSQPSASAAPPHTRTPHAARRTRARRTRAPRIRIPAVLLAQRHNMVAHPAHPLFSLPRRTAPAHAVCVCVRVCACVCACVCARAGGRVWHAPAHAARPLDRVRLDPDQHGPLSALCQHRASANVSHQPPPFPPRPPSLPPHMFLPAGSSSLPAPRPGCTTICKRFICI
jgi:hypothetical protein